MGRFDALTQIDKKPVQQTPLLVQEKVHQSANPQVDLSTSPQNNLAASAQVVKSTGRPVDMTANEKAERYTTRLQPGLIKRTKRYAFEHEINDYDVVQNAIREYLETHE